MAKIRRFSVIQSDRHNTYDNLKPRISDTNGFNDTLNLCKDIMWELYDKYADYCECIAKLINIDVSNYNIIKTNCKFSDTIKAKLTTDDYNKKEPKNEYTIIDGDDIFSKVIFR